jgi:hypothetical protein
MQIVVARQRPSSVPVIVPRSCQKNDHDVGDRRRDTNTQAMRASFLITLPGTRPAPTTVAGGGGEVHIEAAAAVAFRHASC